MSPLQLFVRNWRHFILGSLHYFGYDDYYTELLFIDGELIQSQDEIPKLYEEEELLGCFETAFCILYPEADPWCTETTYTPDTHSLRISE